MKISMFHLMPYRELPADFEKRYHSVWVDPPFWELAEPNRVGQYYNWTLDELVHAAKAGMDGICVNEHHQNAYGFMPSPNLMGSALARATNGLDVALVQMGATLPTTIPPIRVAEEYAMLDCISGGRLVAGMPLGTAMDADLCYGMELLNAVSGWKYKDFVDNQFVIAGSPASVRDQLMQAVKKLRVGNLMVLLHIGSMPHELTLKNIDLFAREVQPHFRKVWDEEGWDNRWWPAPIKSAGPRASTADNSGEARSTR